MENKSNNITNVFLMGNKSNLVPIGTIKYINEKNIMHQVNPIYAAIPSVESFNDCILNYIKNDHDRYDEDAIYIINVEDIFGIIFKILRWRRSTGYLVFQKSKKGSRFLCYLHDEIKHSATSFGTSVEHVEKSYVIKMIIESKPHLQEYVGDNKSLLFIEDDINKMDINIDKIFGV